MHCERNILLYPALIPKKRKVSGWRDRLKESWCVSEKRNNPKKRQQHQQRETTKGGRINRNSHPPRESFAAFSSFVSGVEFIQVEELARRFQYKNVSHTKEGEHNEWPNTGIHEQATHIRVLLQTHHLSNHVNAIVQKKEGKNVSKTYKTHWMFPHLAYPFVLRIQNRKWRFVQASLCLPTEG